MKNLRGPKNVKVETKTRADVDVDVDVDVVDVDVVVDVVVISTVMFQAPVEGITISVAVMESTTGAPRGTKVADVVVVSSRKNLNRQQSGRSQK